MNVRGEAVEVLNGRSLDFVNHVVIEEQPKPVTLDNAYVMATIRARAAVYDDCGQIVEPIRIDSVVRGVEQPQLKRKDHPMRHLDMPIELLHVLEALQVQGQYHGQLLDAHSLLRLLVATAVVALELVVRAKGFRVAEAAQAMRDRRVLVHVHLQIEEVLVLAAHGLAVQTARLRREDPLKDLVHPGGLRVGSIRLTDWSCGRCDAATAVQNAQRARRVAAIPV